MNYKLTIGLAAVIRLYGYQKETETAASVQVDSTETAAFAVVFISRHYD